MINHDPCLLAAGEAGTPDICAKIWEDTSCQSAVPKYYFNPESVTCQRFNYRGCLGNDNSFNSVAECQNTCSPSEYCSFNMKYISVYETLEYHFFFARSDWLLNLAIFSVSIYQIISALTFVCPYTTWKTNIFPKFDSTDYLSTFPAKITETPIWRHSFSLHVPSPILFIFDILFSNSLQ